MLRWQITEELHPLTEGELVAIEWFRFVICVKRRLQSGFRHRRPAGRYTIPRPSSRGGQNIQLFRGSHHPYARNACFG